MRSPGPPRDGREGERRAHRSPGRVGILRLRGAKPSRMAADGWPRARGPPDPSPRDARPAHLRRGLEHPIQVLGKDRERPDLLLDVRTSMTLVTELDVLEVDALALAERYELVAEDPRLRHRAARVVDAMDHEELRFEAVGELDRASITPQRAILLGIAHLLSQEVAEVLLALVPHPMEITDADPGHRRPPEVGLLRGCDERH